VSRVASARTYKRAVLMRIIVRGKRPHKERFIEVCPNCATLFSFVESEALRTWPEGLARPPVRFVFCPLCRAEIVTTFQFAEV